MISSSKGTVLCAISLSIDLFIKNLIYKEHKNKPNSAGCIRGSELMRSKFMRVGNCYFHFLLFCCWEGQWGEITCYRTRAPVSLGLVPLHTPSSFSPSSLNEVAFFRDESWVSGVVTWLGIRAEAS